MIQTDAAFCIGKTHKVCQDYALAGSDRAVFRSVWLSDGCSSSPHTDIGARLLAHGMQRRLSDFGAIAASAAADQQTLLDRMIRNSLKFAARSARLMGVPLDSLDATLLGLIVVNAPEGGEDSLHTVLYGDGAVVYGRNDGTREIYRSHYSAGYPCYPVYVTDRGRFTNWRSVADNEHTITKTTLLPDGSVRESVTFVPEAAQHVQRQSTDGLCFAAVLSDGIESFQNKSGTETCSTFQSVDYISVVQELTAFKNVKGEFVHRRLQSFEKECARRGWHHNDDISVAALCFDRE